MQPPEANGTPASGPGPGASLCLGAHINRYHAPGARPTMAAHLEAARRSAELEAGFRLTAASLFVGGPHNRAITLAPAERGELREYLARTGIRAIAHSTYSAYPWGGDPSAARFVREELLVCREAGLEGLVVHLPKAPPEVVARYLPRLLEPRARGVRLYLETPAVRPAESHYETPEKLAALFAELRRIDPRLDRLGLCIDTAHLHTCGQDLASREAAEAWLARLEGAAAAVPPAAIMFHLNDSLRPRGRGPDAHAPLAQGYLWGEYRDDLAASGLAAFVDYARRHGTPTILERKPKEALLGDYRVLLSLAPEAAAVAGGPPDGAP